MQGSITSIIFWPDQSNDSGQPQSEIADKNDVVGRLPKAAGVTPVERFQQRYHFSGLMAYILASMFAYITPVT
jgi:hypothetical protein